MSENVYINAVEDLNSVFNEYPIVKIYVTDQIKEHVLHEVSWYGNTNALLGELKHIHTTDLVTYIGAPTQAKRVIGSLIEKYGASFLERVLKKWVKINITELMEE